MKGGLFFTPLYFIFSRIKKMSEEQENYVGDMESYSIPFTREDNLFKQWLSSTDDKHEIERMIQAGRFSKKAKEAMISTVRGLTDRTVFYSNQTDLELPIIDFHITTLLMRLSCNKHDIMQAEFPHILMRMEILFKNILTRTSGPNRERELQKYFPQTEQRVVQAMDNTNIRGDGEGTEKKKGMFGIW